MPTLFRYVATLAVLVITLFILGVVLVPVPTVSSNLEMIEQVKNLAEQESDRPLISLRFWKDELENLPQLWTYGSVDGHSSGHLHELEIIFESKHTNVFNITADPGKVLIYRQICNESGKLDKSLKDMWFLEYLRSSNVVPRVHGISRLLKGNAITAKYNNPKGKVTRIRKCSFGNLADIRYILMDRAPGLSIWDLLDNMPPGGIGIAEAARVGIALIKAIEPIHKMNVIHGDLHPGNIITSVDGSDKVAVKFIDFERASIFNTTEFQAVSSPLCDSVTPPPETLSIDRWATYWESKSCPRSFRDDMYQILIAIGAIMYGNRYMNFQVCISELDDVEWDFETYRRELWVALRSRRETVFNIDTTHLKHLPNDCVARFDTVDSLKYKTTTTVLDIDGKLEKLVDLVLMLEMNDTPEYTKMIEILENLANMPL